MKYINAKTVIPADLLQELQEYVSGELIYIPEKGLVRAGWGESNGARERYAKRNNEIVSLYRNGGSIMSIADRYHLSEDSIRKITYNSKYVKI